MRITYLFTNLHSREENVTLIMTHYTRLSAGALGAAVNFNNFSGNLANAGMPALCTV
jgi:hypothetical protein